MQKIDSLKQAYYNAVYDTDQVSAISLIDSALQAGLSPEELVFEVVLPSLDAMIVDLTQNNDVTLSQHFTASKVTAEIVAQLIPRFAQKPQGYGTIVVGTARGDFHGLGKKILGGYLRANMFTVHDLGLNVSPAKFVDEAVRLNAQVIGVSSMMMHTATGEQGPLAVRRLLDERGLSDRIKLVVGGAPYRFDESLYKNVEADGWSKDAYGAVALMRQMIPFEEVHHA